MSDDVSTFFRDQIEPLRALENRALDRAISQALRAFSGHIWSWSRTACRSHGDRNYQHVEDIYNVISFKLSTEIRKELDTPKPGGIGNLYAFFKTICEREAFSYFHSGERTGFSNATGASRRVSKINKTRKEMTIARGSAPTDLEVVEEVNREAYATRTDPKKQGALVTLDDVRMTSFSSLDGLTEEFGDSIWASETEEDVPLSRVEAPTLVSFIIEECESRSVPLGRVARAWIGDALGEPPVVRDAREIASLLSLKVGDVVDMLDDAKDDAVEVCEEKFNIRSPFV